MAGPRLAGTLVLLCLAASPALAQVNPNLLLFEARLPGEEAGVLGGTPSGRTTAQAPTFNSSATEAGAAGRLLTDIDTYQGRIATLIGETGPFDFALLQEYSALGRLFQQAGRHEQAIEAFAQAEYVARINDGLDSPQAFDSIEAAVESYIAMGDLPSANGKLQVLLNLSREHYGANSLELVPLLSSLGDWHLIHDRHSKALRVYQEALALMRELGAPEPLLQATFAPDIPVQLPAFAALPHSRAYMGVAEDAELNYEGYVDVSFEISRYGSAKRIRILGSSEGTDSNVVSRLRRLLRSMPFRPVLLEDSEAERHKSLRYYYTQVSSTGGS